MRGSDVFFQVGFLLGVLSSCTPSSSDMSAKLHVVDSRDSFEGSWCWNSRVECGVSNSVSKTLITITKASVANEVNVFGMKGVVVGNKIIISPKVDSFGGVWSGQLEKNGSELTIQLSITYNGSGIRCSNSGTAVVSDSCSE